MDIRSQADALQTFRERLLEIARMRCNEIRGSSFRNSLRLFRTTLARRSMVQRAVSRVL